MSYRNYVCLLFLFLLLKEKSYKDLSTFGLHFGLTFNLLEAREVVLLKGIYPRA